MDETESTRYGAASPEAAASAALAEHLGTPLRPRRLTLPDGTSVEVEAMDSEGTVIAQYVLNGGAVKSSLRNKVAADLFKLVWVRHALAPDARAVLCVSPTVAAVLGRRGWLSAAARDLRITVVVLLESGRIEELSSPPGP
ncbi:hypothetical protein NVV95_02280 [Herbiconiux sp. CPCC 205716]|uniref:Restriction endonuclease type IV Mrr domain-containing protein n=1 Tax=Herbiconiux gentiana TaxID=2970912 RepID=A0ABT2GB25_9MICO|nr:hypothetical protein [Herbiconiux gentiana]MCS5713375.1 hypothetical protein [Herbiconiux gentiana]